MKFYFFIIWKNEDAVSMFVFVRKSHHINPRFPFPYFVSSSKHEQASNSDFFFFFFLHFYQFWFPFASSFSLLHLATSFLISTTTTSRTSFFFFFNIWIQVLSLVILLSSLKKKWFFFVVVELGSVGFEFYGWWVCLVTSLFSLFMIVKWLVIGTPSLRWQIILTC